MKGRPRILVVEDVPYNRDLCEQILEDHYALAFAVDGQEALDVAESEDFDLILLDISLPRVDGLEVAARLRSGERHRDTPIVAFTAHAMVGDEERTRAAGCNAHVTKPVDEDVLLGTIARLLA